MQQIIGIHSLRSEEVCRQNMLKFSTDYRREHSLGVEISSLSENVKEALVESGLELGKYPQHLHGFRAIQGSVYPVLHARDHLCFDISWITCDSEAQSSVIQAASDAFASSVALAQLQLEARKKGP